GSTLLKARRRPWDFRISPGGKCVQDGWRVALADAAIDADRGGLAVGKSPGGIDRCCTLRFRRPIGGRRKRASRREWFCLVSGGCRAVSPGGSARPGSQFG